MCHIYKLLLLKLFTKVQLELFLKDIQYWSRILYIWYAPSHILSRNIENSLASCLGVRVEITWKIMRYVLPISACYYDSQLLSSFLFGNNVRCKSKECKIKIMQNGPIIFGICSFFSFVSVVLIPILYYFHHKD